MRKLIVFLLAVASTLPLYADQDDVQQTIVACGQPRRSFIGPTDSSYPVGDRILDYGDYSVHFTRGKGPVTFNSLWSDHGHWTSPNEARDRFPCLAKTSFAPAMSATQYATTPRHDAASGAAVAGVGLVMMMFFVLGFAFYLLPTIVAIARKVVNPGGIIALNLLLGWTLIGYIIALVWAFSRETQSQAALREMAYRSMAAKHPYHPSQLPPQ